MPLYGQPGSDTSALHGDATGEIGALTEKTTPVSADLLLLEDSAAAGAKKKVQVGNLPSGGSSVFGQNYQGAVDNTTTTTTSSTYQDKVSITTPALTGTYLVQFSADIAIASTSKNYQVRLYDSTGAVVLCDTEHFPNNTGPFITHSGFALLTFTGAAKTLKVQFASQNNVAQVSCKNARLAIWRVA